jgi:stage II sporulation protein D
MRIILFLLFLLNLQIGSAQDHIKVGMYANSSSSSAALRVVSGVYTLLGDKLELQEFTPGQTATIQSKDGLIQLNIDGKVLGKYKTLVFQTNRWECELTVKPQNSKLPQRKIQDNLIVKSKGANLTFINELELEKYVSGVVEAEAGSKQTSEYYKVQAIISRTYALANMGRHKTQGFHLCDQVHCQVYHGKARFNDSIPLATYETKNNVLVDENIHLITAAFSSNCGGNTINAEDVWSKPLPYLKARPDSFCLVMSNSHWEKSISKKAWLDYLNKAYQYPSDDSLLNVQATAWFPETKQTFFSDSSLNISMNRIRTDWKLRSTFFIVLQEEDSVRFIGRGFGHGVGLCQEGAIRMAQMGINYREILHFYYHDVHLVDRKNIDFFQYEE